MFNIKNIKYKYLIFSFFVIFISLNNDKLFAEKEINSPYGPVKALDFSLYKEYYASRSFVEYGGSEFGAGVVTDLVFSLTEENIRGKKGETNIQGKFTHFCGPCHGVTGNGEGKFKSAGVTPGPADFTNAGYMVTLADSDIVNVITGGSASVGKSNLCPPWGNTFDKKWIDRMAKYVRSFSVVESAPQALAEVVDDSASTGMAFDEEGASVWRFIILGIATVFFIGIAVLEWSWLVKRK